MSPIEWLCSVVDTINSRTSRQRFWVRGTAENLCQIENLETGEVWSFTAETLQKNPDNKPMEACCIKQAFKYPGHDEGCRNRR